MSSTYRVLCLSHDPAIMTDGEYDSPGEAEAAVAAGVGGHAHCDLLIGRYSWSLVEIGCPPTTGPERPGPHYCYPHSGTVWVDLAWARLLVAAHDSTDVRVRVLAADRGLAHWPWERLRRLWDVLGLEARGSASPEPPVAAEPAPGMRIHVDLKGAGSV
ncbi:hypothetical protein ACFYOK_37380 [Microbispora bryophytorum]|uniref:hypothetical protein n=1 Tax=Microbispora bryophytorum TaxID=1460882 RepID=UPI00341058DA